MYSNHEDYVSSYPMVMASIIPVACVYHDGFLHRIMYWNTDDHYLFDTEHPEIKCPHPSFSLRQAIEDAMWWPVEEVRKKGKKPELMITMLTGYKDYVYEFDCDNNPVWKWTGHCSRVEEYRYNYDKQLWNDFI